MTEGKGGPPPTLPLPSLWRLAVAAIAVVGFLYLMYRTGAREEAPPPPQGSQQSLLPASGSLVSDT